MGGMGGMGVAGLVMAAGRFRELDRETKNTAFAGAADQTTGTRTPFCRRSRLMRDCGEGVEVRRWRAARSTV